MRGPNEAWSSNLRVQIVAKFAITSRRLSRGQLKGSINLIWRYARCRALSRDKEGIAISRNGKSISRKRFLPLFATIFQGGKIFASIRMRHAFRACAQSGHAPCCFEHAWPMRDSAVAFCICVPQILSNARRPKFSNSGRRLAARLCKSLVLSSVRSLPGRGK
jgi:hypothetical protein